MHFLCLEKNITLEREEASEESWIISTRVAGAKNCKGKKKDKRTEVIAS